MFAFFFHIVVYPPEVQSAKQQELNYYWIILNKHTKINTNKIPFNIEKKLARMYSVYIKTKITYRMGLLCTKVLMCSKFCFQHSDTRDRDIERAIQR